MNNIEAFASYVQSPWGRMFYDILWDQLSFLRGARVFDFGSGLGMTSNHLARHNDVTAVEPDADMCARRYADNAYEQIIGGVEALGALPDGDFDAVLCHNILEYVPDRDAIMEALCRKIKPGGLLSIVKHNHPGRVLMRVAYENDPAGALEALRGGSAQSMSFGDIGYYDLADIERWRRSHGLADPDIKGIRMFYSLYPDNATRTDPNWVRDMMALEKAACNREPYRSIAYFWHVMMRRG